jgi:predicted GH43/DUF377 family glycosyl hydrolase
MAATGDIVEPNQVPHNVYHQALFERTCLEVGLDNERTRRVMQRLPDSFNLKEPLAAVDTELKEGPTPDGEKARQDTLERISMLAKSNYSVQFPPEQGLSERVIFPVTRSQRNGIEDARFVRFQNDDGSHVHFATFTALNGQLGIPQLLETSDFLLFQLMTLNGPAVKNKGMALFPRKINGSYAMLSRQDSENVYLMFSDHIRFWYEPKVLLKPVFPWELVQIGNCGSPIETKAGWLVLTHGFVGTSGFIRTGETGGRSRMALKISADVSPRNGKVPVHISYSTAPNENRSVRASSSFPRTCSGDM